MNRAVVLVMCFVFAMAGCRSIPKSHLESHLIPESQIYLDTFENHYSRMQQFIVDYPLCTEQDKILYLLRSIQKSPYKMWRNGSHYGSSMAARWLRRKMKKGYRETPIKTGWDFVHNVASFSRTTGKKYVLILPNGQRVDTGIVLSNELKALESSLKQKRVEPKPIVLSNDVLKTSPEGQAGVLPQVPPAVAQPILLASAAPTSEMISLN